jgi:large subunit ribosomal protein L32
MPNPKRRHSKSRSRKRRSHDGLKPVNLTACANCGNNKLPHRVCAHCGYYHGRAVLKKES